MKKYLLLLIAMLIFSIANAQISIATYLINDSTALFNRSLPANTVLLSAQTNLLFRLNQAASTSFSLTTANKSLLTADFTELDPVWAAEKTLYATQQWVTENATVTETDPIWLSQKGLYATQQWVTENAIVNETDPIWLSQKGLYATQQWVTQNTTVTETDPIWLSEKTLYATQQWVTENATVTETDPIWLSQKGLYATQQWVTENATVTETDPIWLSQKSNYATTQALHDTATVIRADFDKHIIIDNSGLWVSSGKEVILSSTNSILTVKDNKTYNFVKTSNNANYTYIDSIEITNLADVEIVATAKGTNTIGTFKHTTAYNSALGVLNLVGINTSEIKCASYPSTHFTYDTRANWLRFKVKSSELVTWKFKVELNYN